MIVAATLAAAVRFHCLEELGLWYDEAVSWKTTTFPIGEQIERAAGDNHPPIYFLLLNAWAALWGNSAGALRSLSAVFGVLTVVGVFYLMRDVARTVRQEPEALLFANFTGFCAAVLVALSPLQIEWSQTVRMYSLGTALAAWSSWALVRAIYFQSRTWWTWPAYTLLATGLIYTHYYGLFVVAAQVVYIGLVSAAVFWRFGVRDSRCFLPLSAVAGIGVLWAPWLNSFLLQRERAMAHGWTQPFSISHIAASIYQTFELVWGRTTPPSWAIWSVTGVVVVLTVATLLWGRKAERLIGMIALFSIGLAVVSSSSGKLSVVGGRYFIFSHVFLLCLGVLWLQRLPWAIFRATLFLMIFGLAGWQGYEHVEFREERATQAGFRTAAAYIDSMRTGDEPILVSRPRVLITTSPCLRGTGNIYVFPAGLFFPFNEGTAVLDDREYLSRNELARWSGSRVWTIDSRWYSTRLPPEWIDVAEERFADWTWGELIVRQYEHRDALQKYWTQRSGTLSEALSTQLPSYQE